MHRDATQKPDPLRRRRIYLMRHGDVSYFDPTGKPFHPDGVPLNEHGLAQAEAARRELASLDFDRVLTSDLPRSQQTAALILAGRSVVIDSRAELREVQPGRLADIPLTQIEQAFLGAFGSGLTRETCFLAGESIGALIDRVQGCLQKVLDDPSWQRLLLVAHGGVNRVILTHALGSGLKGFAALEQDPCCINILDVDGGGNWIVRLINHTPYNAAKIGLELTTMERLYGEFRKRFSL